MRKKFVLLGIFGVLGVAIVTATLLAIYGSFSALAFVSQSIIVDNGQFVQDEITEPSPGGETFCFKHWIENKASVDIDVGIQTIHDPVDAGISTDYYALEPVTTLVLENKNENWVIIDDYVHGTLTYKTVNPSFDFELHAQGLIPNTEYSLIYYSDDGWEGNNPGMLLAEGTSNGNGFLDLSDQTELMMNLPQLPDTNIFDNDYCDAPDFYEHCHGAKIWLIPSSDYDSSTYKLTAWNPENYLFETDLVVYLNCGIPVDWYFSELAGSELNETMTTTSKEKTPILACHSFEPNISPGTYNLTTNIVAI